MTPMQISIEPANITMSTIFLFSLKRLNFIVGFPFMLLYHNPDLESGLISDGSTNFYLAQLRFHYN